MDCDAQGNASTGLGIEPAARRKSSYDVLVGEATMGEAILPTRAPNLDILPGDENLAGVETLIHDDPRKNFKLREAFEAFRRAGARYDVAPIDCPPSLSTVTINAMVAANAVLVPLQCEFLAMEGLSQILRRDRAGAVWPQSGSRNPGRRADHVPTSGTTCRTRSPPEVRT